MADEQNQSKDPTEGAWREIKSTIHTRYEAYPGYISSHDSLRESDEKLAALAKQLRGKND